MVLLSLIASFSIDLGNGNSSTYMFVHYWKSSLLDPQTIYHSGYFRCQLQNAIHPVTNNSVVPMVIHTYWCLEN